VFFVFTGHGEIILTDKRRNRSAFTTTNANLN
jgi:hypothetical protein